ncbi:hypothetical protein [Bacillus altitudinis]|uniref:hypothetical protein n=1 Tax=Bacillus altitudinis TaxID=293387 RepID=UPI00366DF456
MRINRSGSIRLADAALYIREEGISICDPAEDEYKKQVFKRIIQKMNRLGWSVAIPPEKVQQHGIRFARRFRFCVKGDLKADLEISGCSIELKFFQNVNAPDRPDHDGRYQSDKEKHMPFLMLMEMRRTRNAIIKYLTNVFTNYTVDDYQGRSSRNVGPGGITAMQWLDVQYKESCHFKGDVATYEISNYNRGSADGKSLAHGQRVYFFDRKGRVQTGTAYYNINNMWWVITGKYDWANQASFHLYTAAPENIRMKRNERRRRQRLESLLSDAVTKMDFLRAHQLKGLLFKPDEQLYRLFHKGHQLYHRSGFNGYTKDPNYAGKFRLDECKRFGNDHENVLEEISLVGMEKAS